KRLAVWVVALSILGGVAAVCRSEGEDAAYWIEVMREMTNESRKAGREALIAMGAEAVPALIEACADENDWIRWEAVNALGSIAHADHESALPAIPAMTVVALTDDNPHPRWRSLYALACFPQETIDGITVPLLLAGLDDPDPQHRWYAAVALAYFKQKVAAPFLNEGLTREDSYERWEAVYCLGFVHDEDSVGLLIAVLLDVENQETRIRQETALVLGRIGDPVAAPALIEALEDPEAAVRWRAASSLSRFADPSVLPALEAAYEREEDEFAKEQIAKAIGQLTDEDL
ncbi:MAG: HEAT repeat domain-containing protein, partial [Candidatus Bipolaricaulota bacterium]